MAKKIIIPSTLFNVATNNNDRLTINVLGVNEHMEPFIMDRPFGTGDYLLMQFHSPAIIQVVNTQNIYPKGTMIIWTPGTRQCYGYTEKSASQWLHSWLHCNGKIIRQLLQQADLPTNRPFGPLDSQYFDNAIAEIYAEHKGNHSPSEIIIQNILQNCFVRISRSMGSQITFPQGLIRVRNHIEQNPCENVTLEQLSKISGYSITHLSLLFRKYFGISPIAYANQVRMHRAMMLLHDKNRTISQIARETRFGDIYHFSRRFKEFWGKSPSQARYSKIHKNKDGK